jgi:hypothetical protein
LIWETKVTVPENLLVLLVPLFALALHRARLVGSRLWAAVAGVLVAAASLTHALYLVGIAAGTLVLIASCHGLRRDALNAAIFLAVASLPTGLWVARNAQLGWPGLATGFGLHYWKGVYAFERLRSDPVSYFQDHDADSNAFVQSLPEMKNLMLTNAARSDPKVNAILDRAATTHAQSRPGEVFMKTLIKVPLAWVQQQTPLRSLANALLVLPLLLGAARGAWRGGTRVLAVSLPLAFLNLAAAAVFVEGIPMRYALPWIPLTAVLAVAGWRARRSCEPSGGG